MSSLADPRGGRSIAWPVFALVIASVVVATAIFFVVTFNGPPPMDRPHAMPLLADMLTTGKPVRGPGPGGPAPVVTRERAAPTPRSGEREDMRVRRALAAMVHRPMADLRAYTKRDARQGPEPGDEMIGSFTLGLRTGDGWTVVRKPAEPRFTRWHWVTLAAMLAAITALSVPAWAIARAITRPLRDLAEMASRARAGVPLPPLPQTGSREVRALGSAVAAMHTRLAGHAEGRTTMLAAIAHDLGTPLTRLAFWVEQLPDAARARASADIDEMRSMIGGALRFARDEGGEHAATRIDLGSLLDTLVEDMALAGAPVTLTAGPRAVVRGDAGALRRLFANLLDNAVRYGDRAAVGWHLADGLVSVTIDDAGPGVDPIQVERLFEPFVRGDPSRNRATGGTGLGLAIVRSIAERHRGGATLETGPIGGARARVWIPFSR